MAYIKLNESGYSYRMKKRDLKKRQERKRTSGFEQAFLRCLYLPLLTPEPAGLSLLNLV